MATLAADSPMIMVGGERNHIPIIADDIVYEGALVGDNASGYGQPLVAGDPFRGHAVKKVDNTGGAAGVKNIEVLSGRYRLEVSLAGAITDVGRKVYASDDAVLTFVADGNSYVGTVTRYISATKLEVEFVTTGEVGGVKLAYANTARATSVEGVTAETDFDKTVTLDGKRFKKGDVFNIKAMVWIEDQNSTNTQTLKLYFGTEVIWNSGAVQIADNDLGFIDIDVVINVVGASGKISFAGVGALGVPGTIVPKPVVNSTAAGEAEDISGDVVIKMSATASAEHADNECELTHLIVTKA